MRDLSVGNGAASIREATTLLKSVPRGMGKKVEISEKKKCVLIHKKK